jgi:hypothetical protein
VVIALLVLCNPPHLDIAYSRWPESPDHFRDKPVPEASISAREIDFNSFLVLPQESSPSSLLILVCP